MIKSALIAVLIISIPIFFAYRRSKAITAVVTKGRFPKTDLFLLIGFKILLLIVGLKVARQSHFTNLWAILLVIYASCALVALIIISLKLKASITSAK